MIIVIQRVTNASVKVDDKVVSSINNGMLILLGISNDDSKEDIIKMTNKISKLRIFNDENDIMNKNVNEVNGEVLVVSQFTLCGNVKKGNRPSYIEAAKPDIAKPIYNLFIKQLDSLINNKVQSGIFGAYMLVDIVNDGPVTLIV
ncbi:MAG: D-tyrosyl-tRNA(Tyr) deacylase [Flavobacteriaceae bacterium]|nr:D-tyrosyl-tRNA(Tyr) deacylase [Flavobacteriaceae bacterium]|tara:strand:+ start:337 stop:771 length:435 start_codon:yes stop_codon:yes gene_type:complete